MPTSAYVNPNTGKVEELDSELAKYYRGYRAATADEIAAKQAADAEREQYTSLGSQVTGSLASAAGGLSFGLSDMLMSELDPEWQTKRQKFGEYNPILDTGAEIAGMVAPAILSGGSSLAARGLAMTPAGIANLAGRGVAKTVLGRAGGAAPGLLTRAMATGAGESVEGAFQGAGAAMADHFGRGEELTAEKLFTEVGLGAGFGAGFGSASELLGSAASAAKNAALNRAYLDEEAAIGGLAALGMPRANAKKLGVEGAQRVINDLDSFGIEQWRGTRAVRDQVDEVRDELGREIGAFRARVAGDETIDWLAVKTAQFEEVAERLRNDPTGRKDFQEVWDKAYGGLDELAAENGGRVKLQDAFDQRKVLDDKLNFFKSQNEPTKQGFALKLRSGVEGKLDEAFEQIAASKGIPDRISVRGRDLSYREAKRVDKSFIEASSALGGKALNEMREFDSGFVNIAGQAGLGIGLGVDPLQALATGGIMLGMREVAKRAQGVSAAVYRKLAGPPQAIRRAEAGRMLDDLMQVEYVKTGGDFRSRNVMEMRQKGFFDKGDSSRDIVEDLNAAIDHHETWLRAGEERLGPTKAFQLQKEYESLLRFKDLLGRVGGEATPEGRRKGAEVLAAHLSGNVGAVRYDKTARKALEALAADFPERSAFAKAFAKSDEAIEMAAQGIVQARRNIAREAFNDKAPETKGGSGAAYQAPEPEAVRRVATLDPMARYAAMEAHFNLISDSLGPQFGAAYMQQVDRALKAAAKRVPLEFQEAQFPWAPPQKTRISPLDRRKYERAMRGIMDPNSVLRDMSRGKFDRDAIEAMKEVYPARWSELQEVVQQEVLVSGSTLDTRTRQMLGIVMEFPADRSQRPEFVFESQEAWKAMGEAEQKGGGGGGAPDVAQGMQTNAQRIEGL